MEVVSNNNENLLLPYSIKVISFSSSGSVIIPNRLVCKIDATLHTQLDKSIYLNSFLVKIRNHI